MFCLSSNLSCSGLWKFFGFGSGFGFSGWEKLVPPLLLPYSHHYKRGYLLFKSSKEASCRFHASLSTTNSYHIRRSVDEPRMTDCRQNRRGQQMSDRRLEIRPSAGVMGGLRRNFPSPDLRPNSNWRNLSTFRWGVPVPRLGPYYPDLGFRTVVSLVGPNRYLTIRRP